MDINIVKNNDWSYSESIDLFNYFKNKIINLFKQNGMTFSDIILYKSMVNSQSFSRWFESEFKRVLGLTNYSNNQYDIFDAKDNEDNIEIKYASYSNSRGASFPQLFRIENIPDYYLLNIFKDNELISIKIPGNDLHNSIIYEKSSSSHAKTEKEKRCNLKFNTPEMNYLLKYRNSDIEKKIQSSKYFLPK